MLLEPIPNIPVAFCKYVHLNNKRFESDFPMHVQLTITWHNQTIKEGAAVWSENVTTFGFNTCVLVAGRHFLGIVPTPTVFWMAYQKGLIASSEGQLIGGSIDMPSWFSGSRCERLPVVYHLSVKLFCSVNRHKYLTCILQYKKFHSRKMTLFCSVNRHKYLTYTLQCKKKFHARQTTLKFLIKVFVYYVLMSDTC